VLVEQLLGTGKAFFRHQGGHGDLDPLFAGTLVACCGAGCSCTSSTLWAHNACARRDAGLTEAGDAAIGRVTQDAPHDRTFPATCSASRNAFAVEATCDLSDAESLDCVHLIDAPYYTGLGFIDNIRGGHLVRLTDVTVSIGSAAQYAHLTGLRPLSPCGDFTNTVSTPWWANSSINRIWYAYLRLKRSGEYASSTWICPSAARSRTRSKPGRSSVAPL